MPRRLATSGWVSQGPGDARRTGHSRVAPELPKRPKSLTGAGEVEGKSLREHCWTNHPQGQPQCRASGEASVRSGWTPGSLGGGPAKGRQGRTSGPGYVGPDPVSKLSSNVGHLCRTQGATRPSCNEKAKSYVGDRRAFERPHGQSQTGAAGRVVLGLRLGSARPGWERRL